MRKLFKMIESNSYGHLTSIILTFFFPFSSRHHPSPPVTRIVSSLWVASCCKRAQHTPSNATIHGIQISKLPHLWIWEMLCVFPKEICPFNKKKTCLVWTFRLFCPKIGGYIDIHRFHLIWMVSMSFPCDFPMIFFWEKKHHHVSAGYSSDTQRPCELCFAMATKIRYSKTVGWIGCRNSMILLHGCWDFLDFRYSNMYWNLHQNMGVESCSHDEWCLQTCFSGWCIKQN